MHPIKAKNKDGLPDDFPPAVPLIPGAVPSNLIGSNTNRKTADGRWLTTKSNPYVGKMSAVDAEAKAKSDAAKRLTDAGFVPSPNDHRNIFTNDMYYVEFRVLGNQVSYEIGPKALLRAPSKP